jgi:predicted RNA-binding Zn-ribbon protein involved in translation (DUF1610 family)
MTHDNPSLGLESKSTIAPEPHIGFKTKLLVLLLMVLIISSGSLYYIQVPLSYYGFLGLSVFIILVIMFLIGYIIKRPSELFPKQPTELEDTSGEDIANPRLENILKAEKKYKRKFEKTETKSKALKKRQKGFDSKAKSKVKEVKRKSHRIGSIPLEETIFREKIKLQKSDGKKISPGSSKKVTTFLCPSCGSKELYYEAGLISGYKYHCKDCDYIGSFIIEKDFKINGSK